eukprot:57482_1
MHTSSNGSSIDTIIQPYREYPHSLLSRKSCNDFCIVCAETKQYRKLAVSHVLSGDRVFELGCSYGKATQIILKQTDVDVIAVDNSQECTQSTAALCNEAVESGRLVVKTTDVVSNPAQCIKIGRQLGDEIVVFVDIGGNRNCKSVLSVVVLLLTELRPLLVVVKCRELHTAVIKHELSENKCNFWEWAIADNKLQTLTADSGDDLNPLSAPDEKRICYSFVNRGVCKRSRCVYRHLGPSHPDVIADKKKREQLGWTPKRTRSKMEKTVVLDSNLLWIMLVITLIVLVVSMVI